MQLLTKEIRKDLPALYSQEAQGDNATAYVKFFTPWTSWTWYATEFDGEDIFFGLVVGHEIELGYFSLSELSEIDGPVGLKIERDRSFRPATLTDIRAKYEKI